MRDSIRSFVVVAMAATCAVGLGLGSPALAQDGSGGWGLDQAHTSLAFEVTHAGIATIHGRFNEVDGQFSLGDDPSFNFTIEAASIDTNNQKRDGHLRSPDFFNVKEYPTITFESTNVEETEQGYDVTGELTMHGTRRTITVPVTYGGQTEFPEGVQRHGFTAEFTLNRSDYGIDEMLNLVSDEVLLKIGFELVRE
jgi:polyisoprenoid-binding protein YceI